MNNLEFLQDYYQKYFQNTLQNTKQLASLKKNLYVNPYIIYENELKWKDNKDKLQLLTMHNQTKQVLKYTLGYISAIHLIGLLNFRVSRQFSLRMAWSQHFCRRTFWIPGLGFLVYANVYTNKEQLFEEELKKMQSITKDQSYLFSEKYIREKYFVKINNKLSSLCEDSYMVANTQQKIQDEIEKENSKKQDMKNIKKETISINSGKNKQNVNLKTDDYYFEIAEIIEELDEENFFD